MTYAYLCLGRDEKEKMQLDLLLASSDAEKEETINRANARAMENMMNIGRVGPVPPRRPRG